MPYKRCSFLTVLISPSGGGKSTIIRKVLQARPDLVYSVSCTTRPPRTGEVTGVDYHFLSPEVFEDKIAAGDFVEWARVHDNYYGTSREFIAAQLEAGHDVILDLDVQGARGLKDCGLDVVSIFLLPPSQTTWINRLRERNTDGEAVIQRRLITAKDELQQVKDFDYLVINDKLDEAVTDVLSIIKAEENRLHRFDDIIADFTRE